MKGLKNSLLSSVNAAFRVFIGELVSTVEDRDGAADADAGNDEDSNVDNDGRG